MFIVTNYNTGNGIGTLYTLNTLNLFLAKYANEDKYLTDLTL